MAIDIINVNLRNYTFIKKKTYRGSFFIIQIKLRKVIIILKLRLYDAVSGERVKQCQ